MARSKTHPLTSVTLRMPDEILHKIDTLAANNSHDRTAEIVGACRHWAEIDGILGTDASTKEKLEALKIQIATMEQSIIEISSTLRQLEENNTALLHIIETLSRK